MRGEGYANIPCDLSILKENKISYSWNTLRVGKKYDLFDNVQISDYAAQYLSEHPQETNQFIAELVCCDKTMLIDDILNKVADVFDNKIEPDSVAWLLEKRKLQFCILMYLKRHALDDRELLDKIAQVYEDFDFPKDMEGFIYYMSAKNFNPLEHSQQECIQRLRKLFEDFLINEKKFLVEIK